MKSILRIILVFIFAVVLLNFTGCVTEENTQEQVKSDQDAKALQESMQQVSPSLLPPPQDVVEGPVPPENKNITMFYYVQSGDTLSKIAKQIYGSASEWKKLAQMNNLKDPNHIYAGDFIHYELNQPSKAFADAYENAPQAKIIVKSGDTLSGLSRAVFGKASDWRVLWKENPQVKDPDKLVAGQELFFKPKALKIKTQDRPAEVQSQSVPPQDASQSAPIIEPEKE